jgi:hypothetical protein
MLTRQDYLHKRDELVTLGYAVIPGILSSAFLEELRVWSEGVFKKVPVDPKYRYQGSDIHVSTQRRWDSLENPLRTVQRFPDSIVDRLVDWSPAWEACRSIGLEDEKPSESMIMLSKPGSGPPLYWHQDFMNWNHPEAASPWPTKVFLSYYLTDTVRENGCLRAIPGSHLKRHPLHDILPPAHGPDIQAIDDLTHPVFQDAPDAVDLPVHAGDLVFADARLLHAAWPNQTDQRRTLLLQWHSVFPFPNPPSWWTGEIPDVIRNADPDRTYESTRTPGIYLP